MDSSPSKTAISDPSYLRRIRDISSREPWPSHLTNLISQPPMIRLDEITACICHVALVEIGFIPTYSDVDPVFCRFMSDKERISSLSSAIPSNLRNSDAGILTISYRGIKENKHKPEVVKSLASLGEELEPRIAEEIELEEAPNPLYIFTSPVDVTMIPQNGTLFLYGHVRSDSADSTLGRVPSNQHHSQVNIRDFLSPNSPVKNFGVDAVLPPDQWLKFLENLNGASLSDLLKGKFGQVLLSMVEGVSFEPSLHHLSPELLLRVLKYLPIQDICHVTQVSHYMYAISDNDYFWLSLIGRDFPREAPAIRDRIASKTSLTENAKRDNATPNVPVKEGSAYQEYVRLYQANHPRRPVRSRPYSFHRLFVPRRSFNPLLGSHPPLFRSFW